MAIILLWVIETRTCVRGIESSLAMMENHAHMSLFLYHRLQSSAIIKARRVSFKYTSACLSQLALRNN